MFCKRLSTSPLWAILKSLLPRKPVSPLAKYSDTRSPVRQTSSVEKTRCRAHSCPFYGTLRSRGVVSIARYSSFHARPAGSLRRRYRRFQVLKYPMGIAGRSRVVPLLLSLSKHRRAEFLPRGSPLKNCTASLAESRALRPNRTLRAR